MQINSLNTYNVNQNKYFKNYKNFKQSQAKTSTAHNFTMNKKEKNTYAAGAGVLAGLVSLAAAFKSRKFVKGFNKIFRPYKNMLMESSFFKGVDLREMHKKDFLEHFIDPIKKRAEGYIHPNTGEKYNFFPSNGYLVYGPESKAKNDYFEWMIKELKKAGVEIIDPKPGASPKFDDVLESWCDLFYNNGMTPQKVREQFQKDGKFKTFVVRDLDEIGQPVKNPKKTFYEFPDDIILNDGPDTNDSVEKFGLMLFYRAKDIHKLDVATIREGRVSNRVIPMPYENEPVEVWKNYLTAIKNGKASSYVTRVIEQTKEIFKKRGENDLKEITPYLEYQIPYEGLRIQEPLKKWQNWIEYMGNRTCVSNDRKISDFQRVISRIAASNETVSSKTALKNMEENPKFKAIIDMMHKKYVEMNKGVMNEEKEAYWNSLVSGSLRGTLSTL